MFTITKDKTKGQEFLYFKFDSLENQDKWDRAIYCNYMTKKIKVKSKYFQTEYPEKEEKKDKDRERNILQREENSGEYQIDREQILRKLDGKKAS